MNIAQRNKLLTFAQAKHCHTAMKNRNVNTERILKILHLIPGMGYLISLFFRKQDSSLPVNIFGLNFRNPLGIRSNSHTDVSVIEIIENLGLGFVEISEKASEKLSFKPYDIIVAVRIDAAANGDSERQMALRYDNADMFIFDMDKVVRDVELINVIIDRITETRAYSDSYKPLIIKFSPNTHFSVLGPAVKHAMLSGFDAAMVAGDDEVSFDRIRDCVRFIRSECKGNLPVISSGVSDCEQAKTLAEEGASLQMIDKVFSTYGPKSLSRIVSAIRNMA